MPSPLDIVLPIRIQRIEKTAGPEDGTPTDGASAPAASHREGYAAGYEEGRLRANWEARRERDQQNARVRTLVATLENLHRDYEKLLEEHLPDLVQGALARVFRQHPFTPAEIGAEVRQLLREMEQASRITLECAPAEEAGLRRELEECDAIPSGIRWVLQPSATLGSGEFILKSDLGDVDGRHSTRLRQIHHALEARS